MSVSYGICGAAARRLCAIQSARGSDAPSGLEVGFAEIAIDLPQGGFWDKVSIVRCVDYLRIADNSELFIGASRRKGKNQ